MQELLSADYDDEDDYDLQFADFETRAAAAAAAKGSDDEDAMWREFFGEDGEELAWSQGWEEHWDSGDDDGEVDEEAADDAQALPEALGDELESVYASQLQVAAHDNDVEEVDRLIQVCEGLALEDELDLGLVLSYPDEGGDTPLHYAARGAQAGVEVFRLLVEAGASTRAQNYEGENPLDIAMQKGKSKEILELLRPKAPRPRYNGKFFMQSSREGKMLPIWQICGSQGSDMKPAEDKHRCAVVVRFVSASDLKDPDTQALETAVAQFQELHGKMPVGGEVLVVHPSAVLKEFGVQFVAYLVTPEASASTGLAKAQLYAGYVRCMLLPRVLGGGDRGSVAIPLFRRPKPGKPSETDGFADIFALATRSVAELDHGLERVCLHDDDFKLITKALQKSAPSSGSLTQKQGPSASLTGCTFVKHVQTVREVLCEHGLCRIDSSLLIPANCTEMEMLTLLESPEFLRFPCEHEEVDGKIRLLVPEIVAAAPPTPGGHLLTCVVRDDPADKRPVRLIVTQRLGGQRIEHRCRAPRPGQKEEYLFQITPGSKPVLTAQRFDTKGPGDKPLEEKQFPVVLLGDEVQVPLFSGMTVAQKFFERTVDPVAPAPEATKAPLDPEAVFTLGSSDAELQEEVLRATQASLQAQRHVADLQEALRLNSIARDHAVSQAEELELEVKELRAQMKEQQSQHTAEKQKLTKVHEDELEEQRQWWKRRQAAVHEELEETQQRARKEAQSFQAVVQTAAQKQVAAMEKRLQEAEQAHSAARDAWEAERQGLLRARMEAETAQQAAKAAESKAKLDLNTALSEVSQLRSANRMLYSKVETMDLEWKRLEQAKAQLDADLVEFRAARAKHNRQASQLACSSSDAPHQAAATRAQLQALSAQRATLEASVRSLAEEASSASQEVAAQNATAKLWDACMGSNTALVLSLIKAKADVTACRDGSTLLHHAVLSGSATVIHALVAAKAPVMQQNREGQTPLDVAQWCASSEVEAVIRNPPKALPDAVAA